MRHATGRHYRMGLALSAFILVIGYVLVIGLPDRDSRASLAAGSQARRAKAAPVTGNAGAQALPAPDAAVRKAWARAYEIGVYAFSTEIVQTTYPAPTVANAGRTARTERVTMEGQTHLPSRSLYLTLYRGGNLVTGRDGFEVRIEGDRAMGRPLDGSWQEVSDFSGAFAPGSDLLAYLVGADNVAALSADGTGAHYRFDVDGPAFARHIRDQLEDYLLRTGQLPVGVSLQTSEVYHGVTGQGEIWLDADGLPRRLSVHLVYPREGNGERVEADLTTNFSGFPDEARADAQGAPRSLLQTHLPGTPSAWKKLGTQVGFSLGYLALVSMLVVHHRSRQLYAAIVLVIVASMVISPLLTSIKAATFWEGQTARQAEQRAVQKAQDDARQAQATLQGADWDVHRDPQAVGVTAPPEAVGRMTPTPQRNIASGVEIPRGVSHLSTNANGYNRACTDEERESDTDLDGLTDCDENVLTLTDSGQACLELSEADKRETCLQSAADSDGDGLRDGWEVLQLGTEPSARSGFDSDGDGISDKLEVVGFEYRGQRWYSNPNDPDADDDELPDAIECPNRKDGDGTDIDPATPCRDTDDDGVPNLFDRDSDDDGVPDRIDISPLQVIGASDPFTRDNPFELVVNNLQEKVGEPGTYYPVLVDLQLRPTNPKHLTYVMNVLDWPHGDEQGQIQRWRENENTFGTSMTDDQRDEMPRVDNGDMRLIPMIEIEMSGGNLPLPTTTPQTTVSWQGDISGTLGLRQSNDDIVLSFERWTGRGSKLYFTVYEGTCREVADASVTRFSVAPSATSHVISDHDLTDLADGAHAIVVDDGAANNPRVACTRLRDIPNGPYTDRMLDDEPLKDYGMSVRDADDTGTVLGYLPLDILPDDSGGGRSAFAVRVPYHPIADNLGDTAQRFRIVWLVQILNDWCTAPPEGLDEEEAGAWCENAANWSLDNAQIIHAYDESWTLTGLEVREDHGLNAAVTWEDPGAETPEERLSEDWLWLLSHGLEESFISGRDQNDDGVRDLGIATTRSGLTLAETTLTERFDDPVADSVTITDRLGIPLTATLQVETFAYTTQDQVARIMMTETTEILDSAFDSYRDLIPTLLIAREELYRSASLAAPATVTVNDSTATLDLDGQPVEVLAAMSWAPYHFRDGAWHAYPLDEYWELFGARLRAAFPRNPDLSDDDNADILAGRVLVARAYYLSMNQGRVGIVQRDDQLIYQFDARQTDDSLAQAVADKLVQKGAAGARGVFKVVGMVAEAAVAAWPSIQFEAAISRGIAGWLEPSKTEKLFKAIGRGISSTLKENIAKLRNLLNKLTNKLYGKSPGVARTVGVSMALALAAVAVVTVIVVGFVYGDAKLMLQACISTVMAAAQIGLAIKAIYDAATSTLKTMSKAMMVCAVVGLIVGVVLALAGMITSMIIGKMVPGTLAANAAFAEAVAYTVVAVIMFAISMIPVVGQIIAGIVAAIDALIGTICAIVSAAVGEDVSQRTGGWACKGISGLAATIIGQLIYNATYLIDLADEERLRFGPFDYDLVWPEKGLAVGNEVEYLVELTSTLKLVSVVPPTDEMKKGWEEGTMLLPVNWMSLSYAWQFNDNNLKSATFDYQWRTDDDDIHEILEDDAMKDLWLPGAEEHTYYITPTVTSDGIPLSEAGINHRPILYISEGYVVPVQECFIVPNVVNPMCAATPYIPYACLIPVCHIRHEKGTNAMDLGERFILDVLPETLDEFYAPTAKDGGYSLAWGQSVAVTSTVSGEPLTFARQPDFDGDGMRNRRDGGADPDDSQWDTDGDGLSDLYEAEHGSDPSRYDTDSDGLSDADELRFETDARRKDTDGDGLTDDEEVTGWEIVYALDEDGSPLRTWVKSDPLSPDGDDDGLTDFKERTLGMNPTCASDPTAITINTEVEEIDAPRLLLRLDEAPASGTGIGYADGSGHGKTALCAPNAATSACPYSVAGRYGYALTFDGAQALEMAHSEVNAFRSDYTLAAWVRPQTLAGIQTILATARTESTNGYALRLVDGALQFAAYGVKTHTLADPPLPPGQWTHVAAVVGTDNTVTFYVNGAEQDTIAPGKRPNPDPDDVLLIGAATAPGSRALTQGFAGALDEVAIFARALTAREVSDLAEARYNPNDGYLRPGAELHYETGIENVLLDRYAQGLSSLPTDPAGRIAQRPSPQTFVLEPQDAVVHADDVTIDTLAASGGFSLTHVAQALMTDWREQSNFAELWLPLNDAAGATTFEDVSGNVPPHDGTCVGIRCPIAQELGYFDHALKFEGSQAVVLPDADRLGLQDNSFTVSAWVKASDLSGSGPNNDRSILGTPNDGPGATLHLVLRNREPYMGFGSNDLDSDVKLDSDVWVHLVFRYDKDRKEQSIYVNGDLQAGRGGADPFQGDGTVTLGQSRGGYGFEGWIDDLRIYRRPLTLEEIRDLYNKPVLRFAFEESENAPMTFTDASGFGNTGTCASNCPDSVLGIHGQRAARFGGNDYVSINAGPSLLLGEGQFTLSSWIRPKPSGDSDIDEHVQGIFGSYRDATNTGQENTGAKYSYPTLFNVDGKIRFGYGTGQTWLSRTTPESVLTDNQWHHIVLSFGPTTKADGTFDRYRARLYVNNELEADWGMGQDPPYGLPGSKLAVGRASNEATAYLHAFVVTEQADESSHCEVYLKWDGDRICTGTDAQNDDCEWGGLDQDDVVLVSWGDSLEENARLEIWEADDGFEAGHNYGDDPLCPLYKTNCTGHAYVFDTDNPSMMSHVLDYQGDNKSTNDGLAGEDQTRITLTLGDGVKWAFRNPSIPFRGDMDELTVYKRAFTKDDVEALYLSASTAMRLRLDDPPGSETFEDSVDVSRRNNAYCSGNACPTAGVAGRDNQAAAFDGVDDVLETTLSLDQRRNGPGATLMAWVRPRDGAGRVQHVISTDTGDLAWSLMQRNGTWHITNGDSHLDTGVVVDWDVWQHIAVVFQPGTGISAYKNGEPVTATPLTIAHTAQGSEISIGARPDGSTPFHGAIDDVRIFNRPLSAAEVALIHSFAPRLQLHLDEQKPSGNGGMDFADAAAGHHGTCSADACPQPDMTGQVGRATAFNTRIDSSPDVIRVEDASALDLPYFTAGTWVMPTDLIDHDQILVEKGSNYRLSIPANHMSATISFRGSSGRHELHSQAPLIQNQWNHVMSTYDGEILRLYVNGYEQNRLAVEDAAQTNSRALLLGGGTASEAFRGRLDEVTLYNHALSASEVRDLFLYQGKLVETRAATRLTVDTDPPTSVLRSYDPRFPYVSLAGASLNVEAVDMTSDISLVELGIDGTYRSGVPCKNATTASSWCPYISPTAEGAIDLTVRATDLVGNRETPTRTYPIYVDGTGPQVVEAWNANALISAAPHPTRRNTWMIPLTGTVADPDLPGGISGSGVETDSVRISLLTPAGAPLGNGSQVASIRDGTWHLDYLVQGARPTGICTVRAEAQDRVGNQSTQMLAQLNVDATGAGAGLNALNLPATHITDTLPLHGIVSEAPLPRTTHLALHLEEATGSTTFTDASGAGRHAQCDTAATCPTADVAGRYGRSLDFDGSDDRLRVDHSQINEDVTTFSIAAWIRPETLTGAQQIVATAQTESADNGFAFGLWEGNLRFEAFGGPTTTLPVAALRLGRWNHVTAVRDAANLSFYVNGMHQRTITMTQTLSPDPDDDLIIGASLTDTGADQHFAGRLDELIITGQALNASEIRILAQTKSAGVAAVDVALRSTLPGSPHHNAMPLTGLALHLPLDDQFDEQGNLYFLDLAQQLTGTCDQGSGCPTPTRPGHTGSAVSFDDPQDTIRLNNFGTFTTTTVAAWVAHAGSTGAPETIVAYKSDTGAPDGACGILLGLEPDGDGAIPQTSVHTSTGWYTANGDESLPVGDWIHLAASYDGHVLILYRNGKQVAQTTALGAMTQCNATSAIGTDFAGRLDDVQVYDRALLPGQLRTLYRGTGPVLALTLDEPWAAGGLAEAILDDGSDWAQHATLHTGATDDANKSITGKVGDYALTLDGTDDYIAVAEQTALNLSHGQYTQAAWVFAPIDTDVHPIIDSGAYEDPVQAYPFIHVFNGTRLRAGFGDGSMLLSTNTDPVLTAGAWNHVATTFDGENLTLYVNGIPVETSTALAGRLPADTRRFDIGRGGSAATLPDCGSLTALSVTPGSWTRQLRVTLNGETIHDALWPTLGVASALETPGTFCGSVQFEIEAWSESLWQWVHLGTTNVGPEPADGTYTFGASDHEATLAWTVTAAPASLSHWQGGIDDVRIWARALSAQEVAALYQDRWQNANLASGGEGAELTAWTSEVAPGLESAYRLDLRGRDLAGLIDTTGVSRQVWQGEVDTLAPRVVITRTAMGNAFRYVTVAEDFNLIQDGFTSPCGAGVVSQSETFLAPWYQSLAATSGVGRERLTRMRADCIVSAAGLYPVGVWAERPLVDDRLTIRDATAYVPAGALWTIDVTNPARPRYRSVTNLGGDGRGVALSGDHALVADGGLGLTVVDLNDPTGTPVHQATPGTALDTALYGNYAYVADDGGGLRVIDVSDPVNPNEVGFMATTGHAMGIAISEPLAVQTTAAAAPTPWTPAPPYEGTKVLPSASLQTDLEAPKNLHQAVDDRSTTTPIAVDPLLTTPLLKITSPGGTGSSNFGVVADMDGDTLVVGADNRAYIYRRNHGGADTWGLVEVLVPDPSYDNFGAAVGVEDNTVVVGAGSSEDFYISVYERNEGGPDAWGLKQTQIIPTGDPYDTGSITLDIDDDSVVVGLYYYYALTGIHSGDVVILERNHTGADAWGIVTQWSILFALSRVTVAISGDIIALGTEGDSPPLTGWWVDIHHRNEGGTSNWGKIATINGDPNTELGAAVSLEGDTLAIGAPATDGLGAVSVRKRHEGGADHWGTVATLYASDGATGDRFGSSLAINHGVLAVGAPSAQSGRGIIYLFDRNEGGAEMWGQVRSFAASDGATGDNFGASLAYEGRTLVTGAPGGNGAYLFTREGTQWSDYAMRRASDAGPGDLYGMSVSIKGDTMAVGAPEWDLTAYGNEGAVYIMDRNRDGADAWSEAKVLHLPAAEATIDGYFGGNVATDGNIVLVGAPGDDTSGINDAGAAYIYTRHAGGPSNWGQVALLTDTPPVVNGSFGALVDIDGNTAAVLSASNDEVNIYERNQGGADVWGWVQSLNFTQDIYALALTGNTLVIGMPEHTGTGEVRIHHRNQGGRNVWGEVAALAPPSLDAGDQFGDWVAVEDDTVAVGTPRDDDRGANAGAVYIFARNQGGADAWGEVTKIYGSDISGTDHFGRFGDINDGVLIATTTETSYVFARNHGGADAWGQVQELRVNGPLALDGDWLLFGQSIWDNDTGRVLLYQHLWLTATDDAYSIDEDLLLEVPAPGVLSNDSLGDTASLPSGATLVVSPTHGAFELYADGSFAYLPAPNYFGTDSFTYRAVEGLAYSNLATVTLTIDPINDAPIANADAYTATEDTVLTVAQPGVLDNDGDPEGDPMMAGLFTDPVHGTIALHPDGSFVYTPTADYAGLDTFTYGATDGSEGSAPATVTLTVQNVNDAPVAADDAYTTAEDVMLQVTAPSTGVLANDSDLDTGTTLTAVRDSDPVTGTLTLATDGTLTYEPPTHYSGVVTFTYHADDGIANSNTATVVITVTAVNDPPVVANDAYTTNLNTSLVIAAPGVLSNDDDVEGDPLTATLSVPPLQGTAMIGPDGALTYTPTLDYVGADSLTYRAGDGALETEGSVSLWINAPPAAQDISVFTPEEVSTTIRVVPDYVNDPESDPLSLVALGTPTEGTAMFSRTTSVIYTPTLNYSGTVTFPYTIADPGGLTATAQITVTVGGLNDAPVATDDTATTDEDVAITLPVLDNDTDPDEQSPSLLRAADPSLGTIKISGRTLIYTPYPDVNGTDTFTYTITDGVLTDTARVTVTVRAVNDAPTLAALPDIALEPNPDPQTVVLSGIGSGAFNEAQVVAVHARSSNTTLIPHPVVDYTSPSDTGALHFTPVAGQTGSATMAVTVTDGLSETVRIFRVTVWSITGPFAYVAAGDTGLLVVDLSRPTSPRQVAVLDTPGEARDVALSGNLAYIADGATGLVIADVTTPTLPIRISSLETAGFAGGVIVSGTHAFLADGGAGVTMVDVADPTHPHLLNTSDTPGYASKVAISGRYVYVTDSSGGLRIFDTQAPLGQATACDRAGHCTTVEATPVIMADTASDVGVTAAPTRGVSFLNVPPVLDTTDPLTLTGRAFSDLSTLRALTVTLDSTTLATPTWTSGAVSRTTWHASLAPVNLDDGAHTLRADLLAWNGETATASRSFVLDTQPPTLTITSRVLTTTAYHAPQGLDLTGLVTDAGGVHEVRVRYGDRESAAEVVTGTWPTASTWHAIWNFGTGIQPDGQTLTVTARATDVAGRTTAVTETVVVDIKPPQLGQLALLHDGVELAPHTTVRTLSPTLSLTWTAPHDGSGPVTTESRWTATTTGTKTTAQGATYTGSDGEKVIGQLTLLDIYGQASTQHIGPVYIDAPRTPDYVPILDPDGRYDGWMASGCSLVGIDHRIARNANDLAALNADQRFYVTWNAEALRLAWAGANWDVDGDLFIYLDTGPGGSTSAFDPYATEEDATTLYMPGITPTTTGSTPAGAMAADALVWVRDAQTALLVRWQGDRWNFEGPLSEAEFAYQASRNGDQTDLYLPFDLLGMTAGESLDLVAFASDENALRLWAAMPNPNPISSNRVIETASFADPVHTFALRHRYHWNSVGAGICPNGSSDAGTTTRYFDTDLDLSLTSAPLGVGYSMLKDNLFWLWEVLASEKPSDVSRLFNFMSTDTPHVGSQQRITYTLTVRNRGTDAATGISAAVDAHYALRLASDTPGLLPGGTSAYLALGDLEPGERAILTFIGVVDLTASSLPWAGLAVAVRDTSHPSPEPPLDRLWVDHRVDREPPAFVGLTTPSYVLRAGLNNLQGYAYDDTAIPSLILDVQGRSPAACTDPTSWDGKWSCTLDTSGSADGTTFSVRARATDAFGQESALSAVREFIVDTRPPTLTLDVAADRLGPGRLVGNEAIPLSGGVSDNHGLGNVEVCVDGICAPPDLTLTAPNESYVVDDRPAAPVPIHDGTGGTTVLMRTFTMTDSFSIGTVRLGLSAEHAHRDDLELVLRSPAGTEVRLLADDGDPGTHATGYSLLLDDAAPVPYHATQHDTVIPDAALAFGRTARPAAPLSAFTGEDPAGTWTVILTDTDPASHNGVYHGMRLILEPIPAQLTPRIGTWARTIETEEPHDGVTRQATVYATDLAGNRTAEPLAFTFTVDNVPPVLTSTLLLDSAVLTASIPALTGRVNDGSTEEYGTPEVTILVQAPGDTYRVPATQRGDRWSFDLQPSAPGRYNLLVSAVDAAGNIATVGPYTVEVHEPLRLYMPVVARQHVAAPDLVVEAIHAAPHTIQVTILNRGSAPVETPFWVDVYIDPSPPPDRVNQIWNTLSREGLVWAVTAPLQPGEELTLIPGGPYYARAYSQVTWPLAVGTPVYAQVDSADATTTYGGVLENHEVLAWGYNNIAWCEVEVGQGLQRDTPGRSLIPFQDDCDLPRRR